MAIRVLDWIKSLDGKSKDSYVQLPYQGTGNLCAIINAFVLSGIKKGVFLTNTTAQNVPKLGQLRFTSALSETGIVILELLANDGCYYTAAMTYGQTALLYEGWDEIATTEKVTLSLLNGWQNYDGNSFSTAKAAKVGNQVQLSGLISITVPLTDTNRGICIIPYKPTRTELHHIQAVNGSSVVINIRVDVAPDGSLVIHPALPNGTTLAYVSLNPISFIV